MIGKVFKRWTVLNKDLTVTKKPNKWNCKCSCGTTRSVQEPNLKNGKSKSCGCLSRELSKKRATTHGMRNTLEYEIWNNIIKRCYNVNASNYKYYGGRGITVCDRWRGRNGFIEFIKDVGMKPFEGASIDRIDNNSSYSPENCRWTTMKEQSRNRRNNVIKNIEEANTIRNLTNVGIRKEELAKKYKCSVRTIEQIVGNLIWV